jgi:uncharacterized protein YdaL
MHILLSTLKYLLGLGLCTLEYVVPESTSEYMYILQITSTYPMGYANTLKDWQAFEDTPAYVKYLYILQNMLVRSICMYSRVFECTPEYMQILKNTCKHLQIWQHI